MNISNKDFGSQIADATATDVIAREETSLTRKTSPHRYDSDEEAFN